MRLNRTSYIVFQFVCFLFLFLPYVEVEAKERPWNWFGKSKADYNSPDALRIANNIIRFQRSSGGWSKHIDPSQDFSKAEILKLSAQELLSAKLYDNPENTEYSHNVSTFDEGSTSNQLRFLLRVQSAQGNADVRKAILNGIKFILDSQYKNGGWPQNFPNTASYGGLVTFNDNAMTGIMLFLHELLSEHFKLLTPELKSLCEEAFDQGLEYILSSQIKVGNSLTGWAQQYDDQLQPARGRTYELPAIAALETTNILKLLLTINEQEDEPKIEFAIESGKNWLKKAAISNTQLKRIKLATKQETGSLLIREDPQANDYKTLEYNIRDYDKQLVTHQGSTLWARFYSLEDSTTPQYSDWSGRKILDFAAIQYERRVGYLWHGTWPNSLLKE